MATRPRKKPFKCLIVEDTAPFRRIFLCTVEASTPGFAVSAAERKTKTFMKSLVCGKYHIEASETPA